MANSERPSTQLPRREQKRMWSWSPVSTNMLLLDLIEIIEENIELPPIKQRDFNKIKKEVERREY